MSDTLPQINSLEELTPSQREMLSLLAAGRTNRQIATELRIGLRTVELRRSKITQQFGASSPFQLGYMVAKLEQRQAAEPTT